MEFIVVALIAFFTSLISGMLGLGGSVLLIPAYLYLPPLLGIHRLDVKSISGMTSLQVLAASSLGMLMHKKRGTVNNTLIWTMGIPIAITSFLGAALSGMIRPEIIITVFAVMTIAGALLMLLQKPADEMSSPGLEFSRTAAVLIAVFVGFFGGMVGAPGAFLLSPLMMVLLKIPTRITIGSTLGIVLLSAFSASLGKLLTGQVPLLLTLSAVLASLPGVYMGSYISHLLKSRTLRLILAVLIGAVGLQMGYSIILK
ncbi:MAG TPA: sulfite exporter TauE/SafE family protein [Ignavibacteriales bacterium]|nr:sulfite exporter TauE/SafE family protein [Ignavibacteriales bacterium]